MRSIAILPRRVVTASCSVALFAAGVFCASLDAPAQDLSLMGLGGAGFAGASNTPIPVLPSKSFDAAAIDTSVDPCNDFYQYSCGKWMKNNPTPPDQTTWARSFSVLGERNIYLLWKELDEAASKPQSPLQKQYGDYFAACMNTDLVDKKGLTPLEPALKRIDGLKDTHEITALLGELAASGYSVTPFGSGIQQDLKDSTKQIFAVFQGGIALPDRDYYLVEDQHFGEIRKQYIAHMTKMFALAGDTPEKAAQEAAAVMKIEKALAVASMNRVDQRLPENTYHIQTLAEFHTLAPAFDLPLYLASIQLRPIDTLDVTDIGYFKGLSAVMSSESIETWKSYLRWRLIHREAYNLPKAYFDENFAFFNKTLGGQDEPTPRWKLCTYFTDNALGEAVGQDWVKVNFPPASKASMDKLVAALDKSLADDIKTLPWMSEATKKEAEAKLALFRNKIGYPEKWRDYTALKVERGDLMGNMARQQVFERNYDQNKLGKPVDEKEWGMTPPTVNAYYNPSMNDINFPAGILQPPFFDASVDPAVNFGSIGMVIGHEMTHGFDDQGSKFDGMGNLREWQTAEDRKKFTERTDCEVKEYDGFVASPAHDGLPAVNLKGALTLGENTADNGGLRIAYMALLDTLAEEHQTLEAKIDGYTESQRFFISFAQTWCENITDQSARQSALTDEHSPGRWRTNGVVQNFEEFGKAFGCKKGAPMYPEHSCRVW
jgi:putative endopeptidase